MIVMHFKSLQKVLYQDSALLWNLGANFGLFCTGRIYLTLCIPENLKNFYETANIFYFNLRFQLSAISSHCWCDANKQKLFTTSWQFPTNSSACSYVLEVGWCWVTRHVQTLAASRHSPWAALQSHMCPWGATGGSSASGLPSTRGAPASSENLAQPLIVSHQFHTRIWTWAESSGWS